MSVVFEFQGIRTGGDGVSGNNGAVQNAGFLCKGLAAFGNGEHIITLTAPGERSPDVKEGLGGDCFA